MEKPLLLKEIDFKKDMIEVVNNYSKEIPAMHMIYTIKELMGQLESLSQSQIENARKQYSESEVEDNG